MKDRRWGPDMTDRRWRPDMTESPSTGSGGAVFRHLSRRLSCI